MAQKRKGGKQDDRDRGKKKYKVSSGNIDPQTSGIYATCQRKSEKKCEKELSILFEEKLQEYYADELAKLEEQEQEQEQNDTKTKEPTPESESAELSIEDEIKRELEELKKQGSTNNKGPSVAGAKKLRLQFIDLGTECVVFCKTKKPIDPVDFVTRICEDFAASPVKTTRFTQKLTPITMSSSASEEELVKLAKQVLQPHFHKEEGQEPVKFAIQVTRRNFNTIPKDDIIRRIAECVGRDHGHKVDLKQYDKLIIVECFKSNIGMSVVDKYDQLEKFNLQMIYEKMVNKVDDGLSRVVNGSSKEQTPVLKSDEVTAETSIST
ncbi:hypothetical protein WICPIJ_006596 [Wickerhamomyces pijperi]|uniref:THUMP domain-containing protein n=1 Tax=Wickerhamomyces pijperi TaxID=599730 RepID=A0A9P8Q461_WICPI|nr:hypothetical protein WICPIJ_006596 [Wickerhamomyces pijperi]